MQAKQTKKNFNSIEIFLLVFILLVCFVIYYPGLNSELMFDDMPNLTGLSNVTDINSALYYVLNGKSGPLGRPIAHASFLVHLADWPHNLFSFKLGNLIIHLFNGILLFIWVKQLARIVKANLKNITGIAFFTTVIWLMHPFLATTQLFIVQRMTSLASTFMFMGLIAYMHGRSVFLINQKSGLIRMSGAIMVTTLLAGFTKENGALFPLYILVLESTLLCQFAQILSRKFKLWKFCFLVIPNIVILLYVFFSWDSIVGDYNIRTFSLGQRLLTENIILIDYLYQLLIPNALSSPFQNNISASQSLLEPISTLYGFIFWLILLTVSWLFRKKQPLILFSISWFLAGHALESSVFSLELFFAHRNYFPSISIIFVISFFAWDYAKKSFYLIRAGLIIYSGLTIFTLSEITIVWGQPILAGNIWLKQSPHSTRATQFLANMYLKNKQLQEARVVLDKANTNLPDSGNIAFQMLQVNCLQNTLERSKIDKIINHTGKFNWDTSIQDNLNKLIVLEKNKYCPVLTRKDLYSLAYAMINKKHKTISPLELANLHIFIAMMYREDRDLNGTMVETELAIKYNPDAYYFIFAAENLRTAGLYKEARVYLKKARNQLPTHVFYKQKIEEEINAVEKLIPLN